LFLKIPIQNKKSKIMEEKSSSNLFYKTANLYDLNPLPLLKDDIPFYLEYASKINGNILELACGSGRITIPLAKAGHEVWGVDISDTMMESFRKKIKDLPEEAAQRIHLLHEDMTSFKINQKFPLIIIPFRSFHALIDENQQHKCLENVYNHLSAHGCFIITFVKLINDIKDGWIKEEEIFEWENIDPRTGNKVRRHQIRKNIEPNKQIIYMDLVYYIEQADGSEERLVEELFFKYNYEEQIKSLLFSNGFEIIEEMGYYDRRPITEGSEFIFVCKKK
jgi:SAM-dependent methyltransferase